MNNKNIEMDIPKSNLCVIKTKIEWLLVVVVYFLFKVKTSLLLFPS